MSRAAIAAAVLALGLFIAGAGALLAPAGAPPDDKMPAPVKQTPQAVATADAFTVAGQVLGPDGKPVGGAKLFICNDRGKSPAPQPAADADGRFRFTLDMAFNGLRALLATADGLGTDWENIRPTESNRDLTLRLPADVPIRGKVVDLEGKPVAGAAVQVVELSTAESGNLDEFLKRWAADKEKSIFGPTFRLLTARSVWPRDGLKQLFATTTAADGTFRLTGIGRDRSIMLGVRGPGIANHYQRLLTRPDLQAAAGGLGQVAISGPELIVAVPPSKAIVGTVRDAQTNQPLAGIRVIAYTPDQPMHWWGKSVEAVTDAQGRYRLDGLTKARHIVVCDPGTGAPHMHRFENVGDTEGFAPVTQDLDLLHGIVVSGQVTDRATGRPVRARVVYSPLLNNPHFTSMPGYAAPRTGLSLWVDSREMVTGPDGRYRLTALPGPGGLFVRAESRTYATPPLPTKEDREGGVYHEKAEVFMTIGQGDIFPLPDIHAYRIIRPAANMTQLTADFALEPGVRRQGRLLDPEGQPLAGARAIGLTPAALSSRLHAPLPSAEFTAEALNLAKPRRLFFWHDDRPLAGTVVLRGDEPEPVSVTLQPLATLTGRAIAKTGEPLVGHTVEYSGWPEIRLPHEDGRRRDENPILTDADGRFRLAGLPAGVPLTVSVIVPKTRFATIHRDRIILEPNQTKDLGDLRGDPMPE